jgi:hypothetical protein
MIDKSGESRRNARALAFSTHICTCFLIYFTIAATGYDKIEWDPVQICFVAGLTNLYKILINFTNSKRLSYLLVFISDKSEGIITIKIF